MDPRDRPLLLPDGATCTACGTAVPTRRIRTLARRDDLAFVELDCRACGSSAVGLLLARPGPDGTLFLDVGDEPPTSTSGVLGAAPLPPISAADVEAVGRDLAGWHGDLLGWLGR